MESGLLISYQQMTAPNKRIEPMTSSPVSPVFQSSISGALLVTAHPLTAVRTNATKIEVRSYKGLSPFSRQRQREQQRLTEVLEELK